MPQLFEAATRISGPWALAAFAIAALVYLIGKAKRSWNAPRIAWGIIAAIVVLGLVPTIISHYIPDIYRVRVTVLGAQGTPVEDAKVWSSMGGEPKKVSGGWQFDIPAASRPADGKLIVWASLDTAYLKGSTDLLLSADYNPAVSIQLTSDQTAMVRGLVTDRSGRSVVGAQVSVAGYESEVVETQRGGNFELPAHAARDQSVLLHVEAKGYTTANRWHPAGDEPATIVLDGK
jgi:hypothetical protein